MSEASAETVTEPLYYCICYIFFIMIFVLKVTLLHYSMNIEIIRNSINVFLELFFHEKLSYLNFIKAISL